MHLHQHNILKRFFQVSIVVLSCFIAATSNASLLAKNKKTQPLHAWGWYQKYEKCFRVDVKLQNKQWSSAEEQDHHLRVILRDENGHALIDHTEALQREENLGHKAMKTWGDTQRLQFPISLSNGTYTLETQIEPSNSKEKNKDQTSLLKLRRSQTLTVKSFAFEHNTIGKERIVVPPFTPIEGHGSQAKVWGRKIQFSPLGLPRQIEALNKDILRDQGVECVLRIQGVDHTFEAQSPFALEKHDGVDAKGEAQASSHGLHFHSQIRLDHDGSIWTNIEIDAGPKGVSIDSLNIRIPFSDEADTYSFQKNDRDMRNHGGHARFDGFNPKRSDGIIFDARKLPQMSAYHWTSNNSFVPAIYVGSGTRGLWFYAEEDHDWYLDPEKEHAVLQRVGGKTELNIPLVNTPLHWVGKRTFSFILMAQPVKPKPKNWRRIAWGYPEEHLVHDTSGWRYYADGVNSFSLPNDEEYLKLGRALTGEKVDRSQKMKGKIKVRDPKKPYILYGSSLMAGSGPAEGEWDSYAAEWVSADYAQKEVDLDVKKRMGHFSSYGGYPWNEHQSLKPMASQWTDSWLDFFVYYHDKLNRLSKVNGTWFDNQTCFTINSFTKDGHNRSLMDNPLQWQPKEGPLIKAQNHGRRYHIFQFHKLMRRLAVMCTVNGVEPFWMVNQHPTWSFAQMAWHVEADYYCKDNERDLIEHFGFHGFRAHVSTQGGLIARLDANDRYGRMQSRNANPAQPPLEGRPEKSYTIRHMSEPPFILPGRLRTHNGLCLLHDIGNVKSDEALLLTLDKTFGFFDDEVTFKPYWEQEEVKEDSERVFCSIFEHPSKKHSIAIVFNEKKSQRGLTLDLEINTDKAIVDLETGEPIVDMEPSKAQTQTKAFIPSRNFRVFYWKH